MKDRWRRIDIGASVPGLLFYACAAAGVAGCAALQRTTTLDAPLPPSGQRKAIGAWDLGDRSCIGSIETAQGRHFWVVDCVVKAGYGWCEFGVPLVALAPDRYANEQRNWSFVLNEDGSLTETRKGEIVGRYARSSQGICGVGTGPALLRHSGDGSGEQRP